MLKNYEFFKKLPGAWKFARTLNNLLDPNMSGQVVGEAKFMTVTDDENQLHYSESGVFETALGNKYDIKKEYFFVFNQITRNVEKHFAQNGIKVGLFYVLSADFGGEHLCNKDNYKAKYEFDNDDLSDFSLTYQVSGPSKTYTSVTKYTLKK
jgi:hypothetical protein